MENGLHADIVGDLELTYMQLHSNRKSWKVFRLDGSSDNDLNLDPRTLRSRLVSAVEMNWRNGRVYGNMNMFAGAVWLRLHFGSSPLQQQQKKGPRPRAYNPNNSVFLVAFPNSPYVIVNRTGIRLTRIVSQAVKQVFGASGLKDIQLSGRHLMSLADIVHKKSNETMSSAYRDQETMENPLCVGQKRKETELKEPGEVEGIVDDNRKFKRSRRESLVANFGASSRPILEKLEYKFNVQFRGKPTTDLKCQATIEIKGKSILDGFCQLADAGYVKFPLPKHLTTITSNARNSFTIEDKKKN
ncbi:centromere protein N-A isoform X2 [Aplysia californica]|uniref:Centromere protein N-A isoform X2 n=1 Tax=Aplysia californica TaxID=6500 RepID=A0ABM1VR54_APLCA|nr:centromere protein N-A isoform X2 [Aplysia californica]